MIRGVSALIVCCGHLRVALFTDLSASTATGITALLQKGFYLLTSLGHQAVMVFFVLSGYFVGGSVLRAAGRFDFRRYLVARLSRLWTPLLPALLLTLAVDQVIRFYAPDVLSGAHYAVVNSGPNGDYSSSLPTFLGNMAFVQTVYTSPYGTNGPLWSLASEFWYYILFPLGAIAAGVIIRERSVRLGCALLAVFVGATVSWHLLPSFPIWLLGVPVFLLNRRGGYRPNRWFTVSSVLLFIASLLVAKMLPFGGVSGWFGDLLVGVSFTAVLLSVINVELPRLPALDLRKLAFWLSEISYTLYIVHMPVVLLIYALYYRNRQLNFGATGLLQYFGWLALILVVAVAMWYLFERNTPLVRKWMKALLKLA